MPEKSIIREIKSCFVNMYEDGAWPLKIMDKQTYVFRFDGSYGVMIESNFKDEISETFSNICLSKHTYAISGEKGLTPSDGIGKPYLTLSCPLEGNEFKDKFVLMCYDFVYTDPDGARRSEISKNPFKWWEEWKKLVGNVDRDIRAYPVLGELLALDILKDRGLNPSWEGAESGVVDIRCDDSDYEVKSTTSRYTDEITLSSQLQLQGSGDRPLHLLYFCFQESASGISINDIVRKLIDKGLDLDFLENELNRLGLKRGHSARKIHYEILKIWDFKVDDEFPRITPDSFKENRLPLGVKKITYTVDLSGLDFTPIDYKMDV